MMRSRSFGALLLCALCACTARTTGGTLCERTFVPYMDLISGQLRTGHNSAYLDAMAQYSAGDFPGAAEGLKLYLERRDAAKGAWLYLACSQLAIGKPYDAELSIDHLEASNERGFDDQCEWYTVVCWLCSDQVARALSGAQAILAKPRHTYTAQARKLVDALGKEGAP